MPDSEAMTEVRRPLVSIVVNNYNYGRFLRAAVESALAQRYPRVEVVVVDDGSTDDSREIITAFGERVRPVLKSNGGQASALNAGFAASRGDLVLFLDADDVLDPDAAEEVVRQWRPGVAKVQFRLRVVDADGRPTGGRHPPDRLVSGDLRQAVLRHGRYGSPPTSGNAFARPVLERLMPVDAAKWRRYPDTYLILLSPLCGDVASIDRTLGGYREHGSNAWTLETLEVDRLRDHLRLYAMAHAALEEWAARDGLSVPRDWLLRNANQLQSRLASLRLAPAAHPYPGDRAWRLAMRGMQASLRQPQFGMRKRLLLAAWFSLAAVLPRRLAAPLIAMGFLRHRRPSVLRVLMRR